MEEPNCKKCRCVDGQCFNKKETDSDSKTAQTHCEVSD